MKLFFVNLESVVIYFFKISEEEVKIGLCWIKNVREFTEDLGRDRVTTSIYKLIWRKMRKGTESAEDWNTKLETYKGFHHLSTRGVKCYIRGGGRKLYIYTYYCFFMKSFSWLMFMMHFCFSTWI